MCNYVLKSDFIYSITERIVQNQELVLPVILQWLSWCPDFSKENYLVIKENSLLRMLKPQVIAVFIIDLLLEEILLTLFDFSFKYQHHYSVNLNMLTQIQKLLKKLCLNLVMHVYPIIGMREDLTLWLFGILKILIGILDRKPREEHQQGVLLFRTFHDDVQRFLYVF